MPAAAPDPAFQRQIERICDPSEDVSPFELRGLIKQIEKMLGRGSHADDAKLFHAKALCYWRLDKHEQALDWLRIALQRTPAPTRERVSLLVGKSATLFALGRNREAAEVCIEALRLGVPDADELSLYGNLAEALDRLGADDECRDAFEAMVGSINPANAVHWFKAARAAAEIGLEDHAVASLARWAAVHAGQPLDERPALEVIEEHRTNVDRALIGSPSLGRALRRVEATARAFAALDVEDDREPSTDAAREARDVFDATRPLREAATAHVLAGGRRGHEA